MIVNFWASWCGPCVDEFPLLKAVADEHMADGLVVLGIVYQDRSEAARAFMQQNGGTWQALMDPDDRVAQAYKIFGPPETYFIGRDGTIVARHIGQLTAASLEREGGSDHGRGVTMDSNLPATRPDAPLALAEEAPPEPLPRRQPISVAFLPLALIAFIILAFAIATWTFLATGG